VQAGCVTEHGAGHVQHNQGRPGIGRIQQNRTKLVDGRDVDLGGASTTGTPSISFRRYLKAGICVHLSTGQTGPGKPVGLLERRCSGQPETSDRAGSTTEIASF
jgi:hypothetical protein